MISFFEEIEDKRNGNAIQHKLIDILILAVLAVLCGEEGFVEIEQFGIGRIKWLKKYLELPNGIPSHDTIDRVFKRIDSEHFIQTVVGLDYKSNGLYMTSEGKECGSPKYYRRLQKRLAKAQRK